MPNMDAVNTLRFPPEFYRQLLVSTVEDMVATYKAQDEAMKSGKPVMLFTETQEDNVTNEQYTVTIKAPLLRPGLEITVGPLSKKYAAKATLDALDIVRRINEARGERQPVDGEMLGGTK